MIHLTWKEFLIIYNIIKSNEDRILLDKESIIYKTYKKITFQKATFKKK